MSDLLTVITQNILPIFLVAAFGFALQRWKRLDKQALSRVVLNIFSPCLAFSALANSQLSAQALGEMVLFTAVVIFLMGGIGLAAAWLLRLTRQETAALLLLIMFVNGGNYGMTLNQLRYDTAGLAHAVVFYLTSTMLVYTLGIFIASTGHLSLRPAVRKLFSFPAVYAAIAAVVVYHWQLSVPAPFMRAIEIAGAGAIPLLLVVLGMQIADLRDVPDGRPPLRLALPAISIRLLVGPLAGILAATWLGMTGLSRSVGIIEASMPPAVLVIVLATEFGLVPSAVAVIVVVATLLSPLTVAAVITLLGL